MKKTGIYIVEDEPIHEKWLKELLLEACPNARIIGQADSVDSARKALLEHGKEVDLLFLDINLKASNGFDLLNLLPNIDFDVIITTSHTQFALQAFAVNAIDYLVKPFRLEELRRAIRKFELYQNSASLKTNIEGADKGNLGQEVKLTIPHLSGLDFVQIRHIIYCKSEVNYTHIYLDSGKSIVSSKTLKEYAETLEPFHFFRIHQSYLVNLSHVTSLVRNKTALIGLSNGEQLPMAQSRKGLFLKKYGKTL
ncbi:MAG TPA: response regulator transcription factor [Bacteroidetes bacterium]|nr:response regulator transcription factor [Bacteroidota bacterium]